MTNQNINKRTNDSKKTSLLSKRLNEGTFILVLSCAAFILVSLMTNNSNSVNWQNNAGGHVGEYLAKSLFWIIGYFAYLLPLGFVYMAWGILQGHRNSKKFNKANFILKGIGFISLMVGGCSLLSLEAGFIMENSPGGMLGYYIGKGFVYSLNIQGAMLLLIPLFLVGITLVTGLSWIKIIEGIGFYTLICIRNGWHIFYRGFGLIKPLFTKKPEIFIKKREKKSSQPPVPFITVPIPTPQEPPVFKAPKAVRAKILAKEGLPHLELLDKGSPNKLLGNYTNQELETVSREVEQHLLDFGIHAEVVAVHPGPVVTRFELQLAAGIKVSKLTSLAKDLARSLSVVSVRVVEVIPGKTVVGLELPNKQRDMVRLSDVLSSEVYQQAHSPLTMALGVDIAGHPMVVDLAKMPHLLVAGTTGSGKSVGINAMILSLLFKATPEQVRLIMIDPKMLELSVYDGIPHLLTPVVTDMKEAASALRWCVLEMERRYRLMAALGVRNLAGYNAKIGEAIAAGEPLTDPFWKAGTSIEDKAPDLEKYPFVVVIIDELADMMMVVGKKVEQLIARIAQKARAAGIHLILATQRPSVDVLTGLIKSNIPTRMSFQVSSKIDSRTILDQQGAEQLLGHGDMLYLAPGTGAPLRVHGAFVEDKEVHRVADDWRARGEPEYIEEITQISGEISEAGIIEEDQDTEDADPLYDQVVEFVVQTRKASISSVQRRFKIGYNRAARLIEEMERTGIVGPLEGGIRDVLIKDNS